MRVLKGTWGYFGELGGTLGCLVILQSTFEYFWVLWGICGTLECFRALGVCGCSEVYLGVLKAYLGVPGKQLDMSREINGRWARG